MGWVPQTGWLTELSIDSGVAETRLELETCATAAAARSCSAPRPLASTVVPGLSRSATCSR